MTAQTVLTAALEASVIASIAYIGFALACFISRINTNTPAPAIESHPESQPVPTCTPAQPKAIKPVAIAAKIEPQSVASPLKFLKVPQLQKMARDRGLSTRATDADRRLNKGELLALLSQ
jgi:hypothetical protein